MPGTGHTARAKDPSQATKCPKATLGGSLYGEVRRTLVPCINRHDWGSPGEAEVELAGWIPGLQEARLIPRPTQGWQYLSMLGNLLGSTYFYVLKMRIPVG